MELPIFLLNDDNGGVSAYHDREMLDASIITPEDALHITAWGRDGERLALAMTPPRWQLVPADPPVFDIELLRDLLREGLVRWDGLVPSPEHRDQIIDHAAVFFRVNKPPSAWRRFANSFSGALNPSGWFG